MHKNRGVEFLLGRKCLEMVGTGSFVEKIILNGKEVETDYVLYWPNNFKANTNMFEDSNYSNDIKFDKNHRICTEIDLGAGIKRLFAAGSCTAALSFANSERFRIFNYAMSICQGTFAGYNISGLGIPYMIIPYSDYDFYGHKFRVAGSMNYFEDIIIEGDVNSNEFMAFYSNKGVGVMKAAGFTKKAKDLQILREAFRIGMPVGGDPESLTLFSKVDINKLERRIRVEAVN